jgi:hypothetical protein
MMDSWKETVEIWITDNKKKDLRIQELISSLKTLIQENQKFQTALHTERESHAKVAAEHLLLKEKLQEKNQRLEKLSKILKTTGTQLCTPRLLLQTKQQNPRSYHQLRSQSKNPSFSYQETPESLLNPFHSFHQSRNSCPEVLNSNSLVKPKHSKFSDSENLCESCQTFFNREIKEKIVLNEAENDSLLQSLKSKNSELEAQLESSSKKIEELQIKLRSDSNKYEEIILKLKQEIVDVLLRSEQSERENSLNSKYFERKLNEKDVNYKKLLDDLEVQKKVNRSLEKELEKLKPTSEKSLKIKGSHSCDEENNSDSLMPSPRSFQFSPREFLKASQRGSNLLNESKELCPGQSTRNYKIILSSPQSPRSSKYETSPKRINF